MLERRIGYAEDKLELIRRLLNTDEPPGPFSRIADVLVFAASVGLKRGRRTKLPSKRAEPIRMSVFEGQGYDTMMNLIALHAEPRASSLAESEDAVNARADTFEEFVNGGLELLQEELRGASDVLETIVLMINAERSRSDEGSGIFELAKLID